MSILLILAMLRQQVLSLMLRVKETNRVAKTSACGHLADVDGSKSVLSRQAPTSGAPASSVGIATGQFGIVNCSGVTRWGSVANAYT
jgi:hypothetical protein